MIVFRLTKAAYQKDLSGKGAEMYGGRWNSKGTAMVYCSDSRALAFAEVSIHIPAGILPKDYFLVSLEIPDTIPIQTFAESDLPADWRSNPHSGSTQKTGDDFVKTGKFLILCVPSAVVPGDYNYLINPAHPLIKKIKIKSVTPFEFDSRFAGRKK